MSERARFGHVQLRDVACPACGRAAEPARLSEGGDVTCACGRTFTPRAEGVDAATGATIAAPSIPREELYRRLAAAADRRGELGGEEHLAAHDPALLLECALHHGSYAAARAAMRTWAARAQGPPDVVLRPAAGSRPACAYCRDVFDADEGRDRCGCGAELHPDCREELGRCSTIGCTAPWESQTTRAARAARAGASRERLDAWHQLPAGLRLLLAFPALLVLPALAYVCQRLLVGHTPDLGPLVGLLAGCLATAPFVLGVRGARILPPDPRRPRGEVRVGYGLRLPFVRPLALWTTRHDLDRFSEVTLGRSLRARGEDDQGGVEVFEVHLGPAPGAVHVFTAYDLRAARTEAERIARHLGLGIRDTMGAGLFRPAGTLDLPWVVRRRRERRAPTAPPPRPERPRLGSSQTTRPDGSSEAVFDLPRARSPLGWLTLLAGYVGLGALILAPGVVRPEAALAYAALLVPVLVGAARALRRGRLFVSRDGVRLVTRGPLGQREVVLPLDTIEEVVRWRPALTREAEAIGIRSDEHVLDVGEGLAPAELAWLQAEIERRLEGA